MHTSRRTLLLSLGALLAAGCSPAAAPATRIPDIHLRISAVLSTAREWFGDADLALIEQVGHAVLRVPGLSHTELFEPALDLLEAQGDPTLASEEDFAAVQVLRVEGWVLSHTESALAAMLVY